MLKHMKAKQKVGSSFAYFIIRITKTLWCRKRNSQRNTWTFYFSGAITISKVTARIKD